ncbi:hypothetical protein E3N88_07008 [Mikania micrantha]|uniref:Uncharacterized protein n=1 Tax=Mikania micrantha TaxID=192012 RepID=A0A5N6PRD3_9ASTR|nr:hypothetical protein E3N88_07008 [Mikania micrantha]
MGCDAHICLEFTDNEWKIYKFVAEHNHYFVEQQDMHFLTSSRQLTHLQKHMIHSMSKINLGPVKAFNVIGTIFCGFEEKEHVPNFSCEYFTDDEDRLKGLFWADEDAKRNYFTFGDMSFDATYRSNRYYMVFVPFTVIENRYKNVSFGTALLGLETADTYKLLSWMDDIFELRDSWIPAYYRYEDMFGLMRTTSRSKSENHFFGQVFSPKSTLVEFLTNYETAIEAQRHTNMKNDHDTRYTNPKLKTDFVLEEQAIMRYTKIIFLEVQSEIVAIG